MRWDIQEKVEPRLWQSRLENSSCFHTHIWSTHDHIWPNMIIYGPLLLIHGPYKTVYVHIWITYDHVWTNFGSKQGESSLIKLEKSPLQQLQKFGARECLPVQQNHTAKAYLAYLQLTAMWSKYDHIWTKYDYIWITSAHTWTIQDRICSYMGHI